MERFGNSTDVAHVLSIVRTKISLAGTPDRRVNRDGSETTST
jgi:hypothetical protein